MMIVNANARIVNQLEASLTEYARVIIYNRHMFIVQATGPIKLMGGGVAPSSQTVGSLL